MRGSEVDRKISRCLPLSDGQEREKDKRDSSKSDDGEPKLHDRSVRVYGSIGAKHFAMATLSDEGLPQGSRLCR